MFHKMFYPRQSCFLTASHEGKSNVTAVDWLMPVSIKPPMLAVALNNKSFSLDLLSHSKEFCVCVLPDSMKEKAAQVGASSGQVIDKVEEYQVKLTRADKVSAPLVFGAVGAVECRVIQMMSGGDHTVVLGEVVEIHFPEDEDAKKPVLFNWGSKTYFGMSKELVREPEKKEEKEARANGKEKEPSKEENGKDREGAPSKEEKPSPKDDKPAPK